LEGLGLPSILDVHSSISTPGSWGRVLVEAKLVSVHPNHHSPDSVVYGDPAWVKDAAETNDASPHETALVSESERDWLLEDYDPETANEEDRAHYQLLRGKAQEAREKHITRYFASAGHTVTFTDSADEYQNFLLGRGIKDPVFEQFKQGETKRRWPSEDCSL